jgi:NAD-dependent dihydropyrimidine dehydrogenase PreA subunit
MSNQYGYGRGGGRGLGMGRGMGRGCGRGGGNGRGQGMGMGRGGGRGMGGWQGLAPPIGGAPNAMEALDPVQQAQALKAQAREMANQLDAINSEIAELEATASAASAQPNRLLGKVLDVDKGGGRITAAIDQDRCAQCGVCAYSCPERAIRIGDTVTVDGARCTGCGVCLSQCPNEAISLVRSPVVAHQRG